MLWQSALTSFMVAILGLWALTADFSRRLALDHPNERSLHSRPVPRTGGLAIIAGVGASWAIWKPGFGVAFALAAGLGVVSFADDLAHVPTLFRLTAHLAAAIVLVSFGIRFPGWIAFGVFVLAVTWYENLYNFMDGSDGLAGGMTVIGFGTYTVAAHLSGAIPLATVSAAVTTAAVAFLSRNFHPARIFLGDVGSVPLGFFAAALGLIGWNDGLWPIWFPLVVFAPFVCDATLTLFRRMVRRERVWQAHRDHYYQRLVRMGYGHRGTAFIEYAAMLGCATAALLAREAALATQAATLVGVAIVLGAIASWVDWRWVRFQRDTERTA